MTHFGKYSDPNVSTIQRCPSVIVEMTDEYVELASSAITLPPIKCQQLTTKSLGTKSKLNFSIL